MFYSFDKWLLFFNKIINNHVCSKIIKSYEINMNRKLFNFESIRPYSLLGFDKRAAIAIQNHFQLTNYQMLVLCWIKGLWTGVLLSLVIHYFINH